MTTQALRGTIEPLALVDVLAYLGRNAETGVLTARQEDAEKKIYVHEGTVIFSRSNRKEDRLGDILLAKRLITRDQFDEASRLIYEKGYRHGRALVEIGAISPRLLWDTIQDQIRTIACSVIPWDHGHFEFVRQKLKSKEPITLQLPIMDLVIEVIRTLENRSVFRERFQDFRVVYRVVPDASTTLAMEDFEQYVLGFIDGETSVAHICQHSDIGEEESLRVLYLLRTLGLIEPLEQTASLDVSGIHPMILQYNRIFKFVGEYLQEKLGTVSTGVLNKYYHDTQSSLPEIYQNVTALPDGSLEPAALMENFERLKGSEESRDLMLEEALSEYLYAIMLAIKKLLGAEHESMVLAEIDKLTA
jgi:hypothetical protein